MKKTRLVLGFVLIGSLAFGDIIEDIEQLRAWDLADAYYRAGQQYIVVGKEGLGRNYMAAAQEIFPGYDPDLPAPEVSEPQIDTSVQTPEGIVENNEVKERTLDEKAVQIIQYNFSKLVRGLINQNADIVSSVMDFPLVSPEYPGGIEAGSLPGILGSSEALSGDLILPSDIFDMESVEVQLITDTQYLLTVDIKTEPAGLLQGDYTFVKSGLNWKIQSLGALTAVEEDIPMDEDAQEESAEPVSEGPESSMDSSDATEAEEAAEEVMEGLEETAEESAEELMNNEAEE